MADAPGQARTTVGQVAQYVTILMGANDLCGWDGTLTPTATFRSQFAETLERVCVATVEQGQMTKDLAILIGPDQSWMTTEQFFEAIVANLDKAMAEQATAESQPA